MSNPCLILWTHRILPDWLVMTTTTLFFHERQPPLTKQSQKRLPFSLSLSLSGWLACRANNRKLNATIFHWAKPISRFMVNQFIRFPAKNVNSSYKVPLISFFPLPGSFERPFANHWKSSNVTGRNLRLSWVVQQTARHHITSPTPMILSCNCFWRLVKIQFFVRPFILADVGVYLPINGFLLRQLCSTDAMKFAISISMRALQCIFNYKNSKRIKHHCGGSQIKLPTYLVGLPFTQRLFWSCILNS